MHQGLPPHSDDSPREPRPPRYPVAVLAAQPSSGTATRQQSGHSHVGPQTEFASTTHEYFDERLELASEHADHPTPPADAARQALTAYRVRRQDPESVTVASLTALNEWAQGIPLQAEPAAFAVDDRAHPGVSVEDAGLRAVSAHFADNRVTLTAVGPATLTRELSLTWLPPTPR
jgi:hypothetical protein